MIQRIQSLYLFLAAACGALTFLFPVATYQRAADRFIFSTTGLHTAEGMPVADASTKVPFGVLFGVCAAAYLGLIFLFRDRRRQARLVGVINLVVLGLVAFLFITDRSMQAYLAQGNSVVMSYGASAFLPLLMMVGGFLAGRAIRKDEALVRSMDRLR
jgi:hypothetical protein